MYAKALRWGLTAPGERTENEGPGGTGSGDADCQMGSVCRIWWGLVRKGPDGRSESRGCGECGNYVFGAGGLRRCLSDDLGCRLGVTTLLRPDDASVGTWMGRC